MKRVVLTLVLAALIVAGAAAAYFWHWRDSDMSDRGRVASAPGRIAFWQSGQLDAPNLFVMGADGRRPPRAMLKGFNPAWSPDGRRIAFEIEGATLDIPGESTIWVFSPDAARVEPRRLQGPTLYAKFPAWSPDGKTIAFSGSVLGNWADIYVVPASGGVPRNLTQSSTADEEEPSWSPDGTKIVYGRYGEDAGDSPDIWVMNSDGSDQRALIGTPDYDHSPHGRRPDKKSPSCGSIRPLRGSQITTWKSSSSGPTEPAFVA